MVIRYFKRAARWAGRAGLGAALLVGGLRPSSAQAQAPTLTKAITVGTAGGNYHNDARAVATDGTGNLYLVGSFSGSITFGATTLTSLGSSDIYLAKYVPATGTWAWAIRAGGLGVDTGCGVATSNGSVYLVGVIGNNAQNANAVTFGGAATPSGTSPQGGAVAGQVNTDLVVAKYVDTGTSATLAWTQVAGGLGEDYGASIAVSGTRVYVTGYLTNDRANSQGVLFGGSGTTAGTVLQYGASTTITSRDLLLACYLDQGSSAAVAWTQVMGGTNYDSGQAVAVGNGGVYVTGRFTNDAANSQQVVAGGSGTSAGTSVQLGTYSILNYNLVLVKYLDQGTSATVAWTQTGGSNFDAGGNALAVVGSNVYVAGNLTNDLANTTNAHFGGSGTTPGTVSVPGASPQPSRDLLLLKYADLGTSAALVWAQTDGGTSADTGYAVAVVGSRVYVSGCISNNLADANGVLFGGGNGSVTTQAVSGVSTVPNNDVVVAAYIDEGTLPLLNWVRVGGSPGIDFGFGLATLGPAVYSVGQVFLPATFGSQSLSAPANYSAGFLTEFDGATPLATAAGAPTTGLQVFPNPAAGQATVQGVSAGAAVGVFDALGRRVATATADTKGVAALPAGLAPGLYVVRAGAATVRWVVE